MTVTEVTGAGLALAGLAGAGLTEAGLAGVAATGGGGSWALAVGIFVGDGPLEVEGLLSPPDIDPDRV